jgi:crotonobetainyl-CoA:carnitine CoA-transferase CaiB-like acyl-CoA transferase
MPPTGRFFLALNRSKKSVALDQKSVEGAEVLRRLIATADVLIENFRPGSLGELGFDDDSVAAMNPRLKQTIEEAFEHYTVEELTVRLQAKNVPCGRVRSISEALEHPQIRPREILIEQRHPASGAIRSLAPVVRLSRTPADVRLPPPALGEHTTEVPASLRSRVS